MPLTGRLSDVEARLAQVVRRIDHAHNRIERNRTEISTSATGWAAGFAAPTITLDATKVWSRDEGTLKVTRTDGALTSMEATRDVAVSGVGRLDVVGVASGDDAGISVRLQVYLFGAGPETGQALGVVRAVETIGSWVDVAVATVVPSWATTARIQVVASSVPSAGSVWVDALTVRTDRR